MGVCQRQGDVAQPDTHTPLDTVCPSAPQLAPKLKPLFPPTPTQQSQKHTAVSSECIRWTTRVVYADRKNIGSKGVEGRHSDHHPPTPIAQRSNYRHRPPLASTLHIECVDARCCDQYPQNTETCWSSLV